MTGTINTVAIAMICHEANRAYCRSLGDFSHKPWERAPDWQKLSAISGVNFHMAGDKTAEQSHESWTEQKLATGWVHGEEKNEKAKTHPCLVPYADLPEAQKVKDRLFSAVVGAFK